MDLFSISTWIVSAVFGAGTVVATTQTKVKRNEEDIKLLRTETNDKLDKLDDKMDRITDHLIIMSRNLGISAKV